MIGNEKILNFISLYPNAHDMHWQYARSRDIRRIRETDHEGRFYFAPPPILLEMSIRGGRGLNNYLRGGS